MLPTNNSENLGRHYFIPKILQRFIKDATSSHLDSIMAQREIDIELADLSSATARDADNLVSRCSSIFQATSSWITKLAESRYKREDRRRLEVQIEDYPSGYPRFSALVASHDSFHLCRRFTNLRTRLIFLKQDRLSFLEKQLERIDREEDTLLRLGCIRRDDNPERNSIFSDINEALADYDELIERNRRILGYEPPKPRDVLNLQNWINGNGCIAREETAYLDRSKDLLSISFREESAVTWLEALVEHGLFQLRQRFGQRSHLDISRDPNVHIFHRLSITCVARVLLTPFIILLLLTPVIACYSISSLTARLLVIITATAGFIAVLSGLTKARVVELVVAGATYTTVLIVFISSTNLVAN